MTMDERQWNKARELADAFGDAYGESVARVLGSALMEALSELLEIPLEGGEVVEDKRLCDVSSGMRPSEGSPNAMNATPCDFCGGDHRSRCSYCSGHHPNEDIHEGADGRPYPEFLEGKAAYVAAPVGTRVGADESGANDAMRHELDGWYCGSFRVISSAFNARRPVERWGSGV